ncbi:hypothetical protein C0991_003530, partial [Blastosporella zonata]
ISNNHKADTPPPDSRWPGPWFKVDLAMLDVTSTRGGSPEFSDYSLGLSQVRIMASTYPSSIIKYSPNIMHAWDDMSKAKADRNIAAGVWGSLSFNPSLRMGGTTSRTTGTERIRRRWDISVHWLTPDDVGKPPEEHIKGMIWKYGFNDCGGMFERIAAESIEQRPSVVLGLRRKSPMPVVDIEVINYWSLRCPGPKSSTNSRNYLSSLRRAKTKDTGSGLPAYLNLLHQVSIVVDLGKVDQGHSWIVDADSIDDSTWQGLMDAGGSIQFQPLLRIAETELDAMPDTECKIEITRAVEGRIEPLTEAERTG